MEANISTGNQSLNYQTLELFWLLAAELTSLRRLQVSVSHRGKLLGQLGNLASVRIALAAALQPPGLQAALALVIKMSISLGEATIQAGPLFF